MPIQIALNHVTRYAYDRPVTLGPHVVRLRPAPHSRTRILSYSMRVEPEAHFVNWQQDPQANYLARLVFREPTTALRVEVDIVAEMAVLNPFDFFLEPSAENFPFEYEDGLQSELAPYRARSAPTPFFTRYVESISRQSTPTTEFLVALNQRVQRDIGYLVRLEPGVQTPEETLRLASGSCRDSGWLLVQVLRHLGLAARFVSGYLVQLAGEAGSLDGPGATVADATDLHAWCEVYLPGAGWIGLDPTSGLLAGEGHIPLACTPEPLSAAPISGNLETCETTFEHRMAVTRLLEAPRITPPYSEAQWAAIDAAGLCVDGYLKAGDVRLAQGSKPTFVSSGDGDVADGNGEVSGPTPLGLAAQLGRLSIGAGPGVVEVAVQPSSDWPRLVAQTTRLYRVANESRLAAERFTLDGRHTGSGGGSTVVLGGETPADSPFLRRPDVLASMLAYWHDHPALSYVFSRASVGPASAAARGDELRSDAAHELEIAFGELRRIGGAGSVVQAEDFEKVLRDLPIGLPGGHCAEFCIDGLFASGAAGRGGLLEIRSVEMLPHAQMSLTQQLLVRALVSRFWREPYRPLRLQRWGTALHDRWMLPHFLRADLRGIVDELRAAGYPLDVEWFRPHFDFRFPRVGDFQAQGVDVKLRLALEPLQWLAGEGTAGAPPRGEDPTVERLQVKVEALYGDRHLLTCNGRALPLQPTGTAGQYVAAVRFCAARPAAVTLHAMGGIDAPLTFDLYDTWMGRSVGGCQYHLVHPGGRNHTTLPINALEAEARRLARFFRTGHTPGAMQVVREERDPDFPFTLDLRRKAG